MLLKSGPVVQGWEQDKCHPLVLEVEAVSALKATADPSLLHKVAVLQTQLGCSFGLKDSSPEVSEELLSSGWPVEGF